ncbi:MAG: hypothetical protein PHR77_12450, partial [Kiritimatiellae bacterium]|nr:hypothetical protein [Kiritimatiellia bacterium]
MKKWLAILVVMSMAAASKAIDWEFVEVSLSLRPDGKATATYQVAINPQGFNLHGFYFEGFTGIPHFDPARCYAVDFQNKRYGL